MIDPLGQESIPPAVQVDDLLAVKFVEYLNTLRNVEAGSPFMPHGWFRAPKTIRPDAEFGLQQMTYRELADEAARDLANGINHLINLTVKLEARKKVIAGMEPQEGNEVLHEFVQELATIALALPISWGQKILPVVLVRPRVRVL